MTDRRLLLVHAHPDDESIWTGATMAKYASEGAHVTLVTCTLGEEGDIIPPDLGHLTPEELGRYRTQELAEACAALDVTDHRFLGGVGHYRDSGMIGTPPNRHPNSFWQADLDKAAAQLVEVIDEIEPQVVITYDENGFYGHPDHIKANRVTLRAAELARHRVAKIYYTAVPRSLVLEAMRQETPFTAPKEPYGCPDGAVTTEIDARQHIQRKVKAMEAHRTQVIVDEPWFALSNFVAQPLLGIEHYILQPTTLEGPGEPHIREDDLFAGIG